MSSGAVAAPVAAVAAGEDEVPAKKGGKKKLMLLAIPLVLAGVVAGLWFGGILPPLLGMGPKEKTKDEMTHPADQPAATAAVKPPSFVDVPELIANLNSAGKRPAFVKLKARIEVAKADDQTVVQAAMPRILDLMQTYLREMRPEELRGSAGTWRLREELIARANIAVAPAQVTDVLFTEMLIQ
jgi:flagellar FliL protein